MKNYFLLIGLIFLVFTTSCTKEEVYLGDLGTFSIDNSPQKINTRATTFRVAKLKLNPASGINENTIIDIIAESADGNTRIVGSFTDNVQKQNGEIISGARMLRFEKGDFYYYAKVCCFDISSNKIMITHYE